MITHLPVCLNLLCEELSLKAVVTVHSRPTVLQVSAVLRQNDMSCMGDCSCFVWELFCGCYPSNPLLYPIITSTHSILYSKILVAKQHLKITLLVVDMASHTSVGYLEVNYSWQAGTRVPYS